MPPTRYADAGTPARKFTEPLRELSAFALLAGNAVFQLLGVTGLFFVIDNWGSGFGLRSTVAFDRFMGPLALGMPMAALLLATHVAPMLARTRLIAIVVLAEYGVSAFFGAITFLGAFAYDLPSIGAVIEGLLERIVWLGFLVLACIIAVRVWMGLYPTSAGRSHSGYRPTYGRPYPGQPLIPQPGRPSSAEPQTAEIAGLPVAPAANGGWPTVPPPPRPEPLVIEAEPTMRIAMPRPAEVLGGEATQVVPPPPDTEPPTRG